MAESDTDSMASPKGKTKKTKILFEAWVMDPVKIDFNIYRRWMDGYDEKETVRKEYPSAVEHDKRKAMLQTVRDQFRVYHLLESSFLTPSSLKEQFVVQLHPSVIPQLVELYYSLNEEVLRDVLGKKLSIYSSSSHQQSLESVEGTTTLRPRVVKRQNDNIRHIYRCLTYVDRRQQTLHQELQEQFLLSEELAKKYLYIVFLCYHRFETNKKRLAMLQYSDYEHMASVLFSLWTVPLPSGVSSLKSSTSPGRHRHKNSERSRLELDSSFVDFLRDMKPILLAGRKDETLEAYLQLILLELRKKLDADKIKKIRSKFIAFFKVILTIGGNLNQPKEFRDFFIDIERATDMIREKGIDHNDITLLFEAMNATSPRLLDQVDVKKHRTRLLDAWSRFLDGIGLCLVTFFKAKARAGC